MKIRPVGYGPSRFKSALRAGASRFAMRREDPEDKGDKGAAKAQAKIDELLAEVKTLRAKNKAAEAKEEAEAKAAEERQKELDKKAGEFEKLEAGYKKTIAEKDQALADLKGKFDTKLIEIDLTKELEAAGVTNPTFKKAALTMMKAEKKFEIGDDGTVTVEKSPLTDYIKKWAGTDEGKSFVQNGNGGGGAQQKTVSTDANGQPIKADFAGNRDQRKAALAAKFPDLPTS